METSVPVMHDRNCCVIVLLCSWESWTIIHKLTCESSCLQYSYWLPFFNYRVPLLPFFPHLISISYLVLPSLCNKVNTDQCISNVVMVIVCQHQWVLEAYWRGKVLQPRWSWSRTWPRCQRVQQQRCNEQCGSPLHRRSWAVPNFGWQVRLLRTLY